MIAIDLHTHSTLQPYGQTFRKHPLGCLKKKQSIWYYNPAKGITKWMEKLLGVSSYSQANFTSAALGNVQVMSVSVYAPEIAFFDNKLPSVVGNGLEDIITRYSLDRIKEIESGSYNYFEDTLGQIKFLTDDHDSVSPDKKKRFIVAGSYSDIANALATQDKNTIVCVLNIEGGHALNCGYPNDMKQPLTQAQQKAILENIKTLKNLPFPVFYFTLCHHFYNQLCGHCKSLPDDLSAIIDQSYGIGFPLTDFGKVVIEELLKPEGKGPIYIDIKHMSTKGREQYFELIQQKNWNVPIIYSHGGPNSRDTHKDPTGRVKNPNLNPADLGIFDNEILAVAKSKGIIGLNIDQRVMSSSEYLDKVKKETLIGTLDERKQQWSSIVFENIKYIAEYLYSQGEAPFDSMCMGTDFDGAINPINNFVEESAMPDLAKYLKMHLQEYLSDAGCLLKNINLSPDQIISKIMSENALQFFARWFK